MSDDGSPRAGMEVGRPPLLPEPGAIFTGSARLFRGGCFPLLCFAVPLSTTCRVGGTQVEKLGLRVSGRRGRAGQCWLHWSEGRWV